MIKSHHKLSYLRKDLMRAAATHWMNGVPGELVDGLINGPAALASWIAQCRPDLLARESIKVLVLGTPLDALDDGGWWSTLNPLLGKQASWAEVTIMPPTNVQAFDRTGVVPASAAQQVKVVSEDFKVIADIPPEGFAVVYITVGTAASLDMVLGNEPNLWAFLEAGATIVTGLLDPLDYEIHSDIAALYGLTNSSIENRFSCEETGPASMGLVPRILAASTGRRPRDMESASDRAFRLTEMVEVIKEVCGSEERDPHEDYRLWGMPGILKSSINAADVYYSLPMNLAVRNSTGSIYHVGNDLAIGEPLRPVLSKGSLLFHPGEDAHWVDRAYWAAQAWKAGLGREIRSTLADKL